MGNQQGKESRAGHFVVDPNNPAQRPGQADADGNVYSSRQGRASQSNLASIFSSANSRDREREGPQDEAALAARRETKAEREARRLEKERLARLRERERSMREESVDGGFLVTQGVYTGPEDYNKSVVRSLMIDRRLAPFWPGLEDHSTSWPEHRLIAAVNKDAAFAVDESLSRIPHWPPADGPKFSDSGAGPSGAPASSNGLSSPPVSSSPPLTSSSLLKGRSNKPLASLAVPSASSRGASSTDLTQREIIPPAEPLVNGRRLETFLYKDAGECPICFLYYPPYLNRTRCCDQAICSECFVQIKRPDPHPPEHHGDPNNPTAQVQITQEREQDAGEVTLVSEPAQCPYCAQPEFGVTFDPPPFRRGLIYANQAGSSAQSPLPSPLSPVPPGGRKRAASLPATASTVVTTDRVRPEWSNKLAQARAHAARRSAAATALHTAAYMMGGTRERRLPLFRRAGSNRPAVNEEAGEGSSSGNGNGENRPQGMPLDLVALMQAAARNQPGQSDDPQTSQRGASRRNRAEELEDMMMMEAIRLSLATEEERRKKEDKERAKEEKNKAKEEKKAQKEAHKAARKASGSSSNLYGLMAGSRSNLTVSSTQPSMISQESGPGAGGKGKELARKRSASNPYTAGTAGGSSLDASAQAHLERSRANLQPPGDTSLALNRPNSHLRSLSNASSSASSLAEQSPDPSGVMIPHAGGNTENIDTLGVTPPGGGAGLEPMMNFRSLMSMIEGEDREKDPASKGKDAAHSGEPSKVQSSTLGVQAGIVGVDGTSNEKGQEKVETGEVNNRPTPQSESPPVTNGHSTAPNGTSKHGVALHSGLVDQSQVR